MKADNFEWLDYEDILCFYEVYLNYPAEKAAIEANRYMKLQEQYRSEENERVSH